MAEDFEVTYGNDDGYAGGDRPHSFTIDENDLEEGMTDARLSAMFWERIEEDFEQRHKNLYSDQEAEFVAWAKERIAKLSEGSRSAITTLYWRARDE